MCLAPRSGGGVAGGRGKAIAVVKLDVLQGQWLGRSRGLPRVAVADDNHRLVHTNHHAAVTAANPFNHLLIRLATHHCWECGRPPSVVRT